MAYRRRRRMKRMRRRSKRSVRKTRSRRSLRRRGRKYGPSKVMINVKRKVFIGSVTLATTATGNFWCYWEPTLANARNGGWTGLAGGSAGLSNLSEYQAMYDEYKMNGYKLEFKNAIGITSAPQINPVGTTTNKQYVSVLVDKNSTITPSGVYGSASHDLLLQSGNPRVVNGFQPFSVYVGAPKAIEQFGGGANRYIKSPWVDLNTAGTNVPWRGVHLFGYGQNFVAPGTTFDVWITYYLSFRGMR